MENNEQKMSAEMYKKYLEEQEKLKNTKEENLIDKNTQEKIKKEGVLDYREFLKNRNK